MVNFQVEPGQTIKLDINVGGKDRLINGIVISNDRKWCMDHTINDCRAIKIASADSFIQLDILKRENDDGSTDVSFKYGRPHDGSTLVPCTLKQFKTSSSFNL